MHFAILPLPIRDRHYLPLPTHHLPLPGSFTKHAVAAARFCAPFVPTTARTRLYPSNTYTAVRWTRVGVHATGTWFATNAHHAYRCHHTIPGWEGTRVVCKFFYWLRAAHTAPSAVRSSNCLPLKKTFGWIFLLAPRSTRTARRRVARTDYLPTSVCAAYASHRCSARYLRSTGLRSTRRARSPRCLRYLRLFLPFFAPGFCRAARGTVLFAARARVCWILPHLRRPAVAPHLTCPYLPMPPHTRSGSLSLSPGRHGVPGIPLLHTTLLQLHTAATLCLVELYASFAASSEREHAAPHWCLCTMHAHVIPCPDLRILLDFAVCAWTGWWVRRNCLFNTVIRVPLWLFGPVRRTALPRALPEFATTLPAHATVPFCIAPLFTRCTLPPPLLFYILLHCACRFRYQHPMHRLLRVAIGFAYAWRTPVVADHTGVGSNAGARCGP